MELTYDRLNLDELQGTTQADYLVAIDAHLRVIDGDRTVLSEPGFPVVELARSLQLWLAESDRGDFEFDSMSYEEAGAFAVRQNDAGWTLDSNLGVGLPTDPVSWTDVESLCRSFIARVDRDLREVGVDPVKVIHR